MYIKKDQYVHPIDIPSMWLKKSFINVYYIILLNYHTVIVMAWSYFQLSHVKYWVRATKSHNMVRVSTADPPTHTARSLLSFLMFTLIFTSEMVSDLKLPKPEEREKTCTHKHTFSVGLILPCLRSVYEFIFCFSGRMQKWCPISERKDFKLLSKKSCRI